MSGWDDPQTAVYYEAFCRRHARYGRANAALISHACIEPGLRVLDLGSGTGRTAEAALECLGPAGRVLCVEPSAAMRAEGMRRLPDSRLEWSDSLPDAAGAYDRILCGAAIWQIDPLPPMLQRLAGLLRPGGALCFNIPALYLLVPDEPGGGSDPLLYSLPARLAAAGKSAPDPGAAPAVPPLGADLVDGWLRTAGLRPECWRFRIPVTQQEYADWLKIPVLTSRMLGGLAPAERARRIDEALAAVDRESWKWEHWRGWTAWKA